MKFRLTLCALLFTVIAGGLWLFRPAAPAVRSTVQAAVRPMTPQREGRIPVADVATAAVVQPRAPLARELHPEPSAALAEFEKWLERWQAAPREHRAELTAAGAAVAEARRPVMRELIAQQPRVALARAVPASVRASLPASVRAHVEESFDRRGDLEVVCSCFGGNHSHGADTRTLVWDGGRLDVSVFGRREGQGTKRDLPVHGIALDGAAALREEPYRRLDAMELRALGFDGDRPVVRIGAEVRELAGEEELESLQRALVAAESGPGPYVKGAAGEPARAAASATAWTTGVKKVLVIRIDFSDLPGEPQGHFDSNDLLPMTQQRVTDWINNRVSPMYQEMSYGATSLVATGTSVVYRMPRTAASYATGSYSDLHQDARTAAGADHVLSQFDRVVVAFSSLWSLPGSKYTFAGLASRNDIHVWVNGSFWCVGHELGHTFGLPHANGWAVGDSDPLSAGGSSAEYGDPFDIMGGAVNFDGRAHFTMWAKNWLGWIADSQVQTVTANGTYRVQRFDHPSATGTLALKIARSATQNIWIGLRRNFTDNASLSHGAYVIWGGVTDVASNLLDLTTPGSGFLDAALGLGRSFSDPVAGVTVKTLAEGGTAPAEYLDVQVTFGPAPPTLYTATVPFTTGVGLSAVFNVAASGIPAVSYQWQRRPSGATSWMLVTDSDSFAGAATNTLTVKSVAATMSGDEFRCVVANTAGRVTTNPAATLTVLGTGVTTVAGRAGMFQQRDGTGPLAMFMRPSAVTLGHDGVLYVTEQLGGLRRVTPSGEVSTLVASLPNLSGLAVSADGTSYVSSWNQHTISKVSPAGVVSVLAGAAGVAGTADGQAGAARFNGPKGLAFDPAGNLYVSDFWNRTIRRIDPAGNVSTFAGAAGQQGSTDGTGADARFSGPGNLAIDSWGTLYVSDGYNKVRRITPDRRVTTVQDPAKKLNLPYGLAADAFGNIWVADWSNSAVYRIKPDRSIVLVAGAAQQEGSADGAPEQARFFHLNDLARDAAGALLVADSDNNTIRRIVVPGLPQIAAQPADQTIASGQPLTLTVAAANSAGVVYQWVKDGAALPGATQATYTLPAAQAADGGSYVVMVGNAEGSVTSRRARVTVGGTIVEQPVGRTVYAGQAVEFSVGAVGAGALAYQWTKDGVNLPGAINATLRLAEVGPTDAGRYAVVVSHQGGTLTSGGANLIVNPPVVGWTGTAQGTLANVPADLGDVRQIAAGYEHALALRVDGTVATWGSTRAALAVPAGLTGVIAIAASNYLPVSGAVKNDGSVVLWGDTLYYGPLTVPGGLNNVRQIAIGETEFLALRADGTVFTHSYGQTTIQAGPAGLTGVVAIAKGRYHNLALKSDGTVVTWGALSVPPPAGLSGVVAIAAGGYFAVALKGDGTVVAWGDAASAGNGEMVVPPWLAGVRAIAASVRYTLALKSDGQVVLWGRSLAPVAPTKPPAGFPKELTAVSLSDSRRLALVGKGPFVSLPPLRIAAPGANNTLTASLTGAGEFSVQWLKDGSPVPGATTTTLSLGGVATDAGKYQVVATGPGGTVTSDPSTVVQVSFSHGYGGRAYRAGEIVTFNNQVTFAGAVTSLKWAVLLPAGWSFAGARGGEGDVKPAVDSTDLVDWTWTTPPSSPTNFAYDLRVPAGATGRQEVVALLTVNAGGTLYNFVVRPDPLYLWEVPAHHSADTNRDGRLGLTELTRVIELYNTRTGTTRTGAYRLESNTEDGFAAEPGRTGTASGVLAVYHGADADRDARLSLVELTRVIELYNYRSGTVRTGQYRAQDTTEDGFAPGP